MVSHWSLSDNKSPQVSRTLLGILVDLKKTIVWMVPTRSYFQVLQFLNQSFGDFTKSTNYHWYYRHFHVPQFFQFPRKAEEPISFFVFFQFYSVVSWESKIHNSASSLFLVVWPRLDDLFVSQNPRGVFASHSPGHILGCTYTICSYGQI